MEYFQVLSCTCTEWLLAIHNWSVIFSQTVQWIAGCSDSILLSRPKCHWKRWQRNVKGQCEISCVISSNVIMLVIKLWLTISSSSKQLLSDCRGSKAWVHDDVVVPGERVTVSVPNIFLAMWFKECECDVTIHPSQRHSSLFPTKHA